MRRAEREAIAAERHRLVGVLHDGPQQLTSAAGMLLDAALDGLHDGDTEVARSLIERARQMMTMAVGEMREIGNAMAPISQPAGIVVHDMAKRLLHPDVQLSIDLAILDETDETLRDGAIQIIREAIANAAKHAHADEITVTGNRTPDGATRIDVTDDGIGMRRLVSADGLGRGLVATRQRAAAIGGTVSWQSRLGGGTVVTLLLGDLSVTPATDIAA